MNPSYLFSTVIHIDVEIDAIIHRFPCLHTCLTSGKRGGFTRLLSFGWSICPLDRLVGPGGKEELRIAGEFRFNLGPDIRLLCNMFDVLLSFCY